MQVFSCNVLFNPYVSLIEMACSVSILVNNPGQNPYVVQVMDFAPDDSKIMNY